jgi:CheY-like chemotaxis protein/HPt (histidine-containing phosphotransfer) domain-containing protein
MRTLKLNDEAIGQILDELDARQEERSTLRRKLGERFSYRVRGVQVDFRVGRDHAAQHEVVTRSIGRDSISFITGSVVHVGTQCTVHLVGLQGNREDAEANVVCCRYVQGTAFAHEVDCVFDAPIDPASFAGTAIRCRVLLADASAMARRLLAHMLEPLNVELVCVTDGISAVQRALSEAFDLVLIDPVLPKLDGLKAVQFLRKKGYLRPVCAVSTRTTPADREACLAAGFEEFIPKPVRNELIEAVVQRTRPRPLVSALLHEVDMRPLIDEFVLDLLDRASQLEEAYGSGDTPRLLHIVMSLKADAGGFGFGLITTAGKDVEGALASGASLAELRPKLSRLVRLCQAARPATCDVILDNATPHSAVSHAAPLVAGNDAGITVDRVPGEMSG